MTGYEGFSALGFLSLVLLLSCVSAEGSGSGQPHTVTIDARKQGEVISPLLFGHNLEVTRRGFWTGLSAEMVANRKFAAAENGRPKRWQAVGGDGTVRIDTAVAYAGRQSARIDVPAQGVPAGIRQQHEFLAFRKDGQYGVRVWLKTDKTRKARVRVSGAAGQSCFNREFPCKPGEWQLLSDRFAATDTGSNCTLEISSPEPGVYWLGAVSVLPTDAFHGMRRDVVELLKVIKPGCIRYPGGCYAEFYSWQDGLLPVDQRPPIKDTGLDFLFRDSDDTDTQETGIDEFIALCREIGAEPAITARLTGNTPEDAAAWVEYCNGGSGTKWGGIRAGRGHSEPYNVRWWFLGNELYLFRRGKTGSPDGCASESRLFADAMKKADPGIRLAACTAVVNGNVDAGWNTPLIASVGSMVYAGSAHEYVLDQMQFKTPADLSMLLRAPVRKTLPMLQKARKFFDQKQAPGQRIHLTYDEWNTRWGHQGSVPMGLYAASMLNMLCREAQPLGLEMACYFMPVNEGAIKVMPLSAGLDTAGHVFELYRVHQGNRLLAVSGDGSVDCLASLTPDGLRMCVSAVNDVDADRSVTLRLADGIAAKGTTARVRRLIPRSLHLNETMFDVKDGQAAVIDGRAVELQLAAGCIVLASIDVVNISNPSSSR